MLSKRILGFYWIIIFLLKMLDISDYMSWDILRYLMKKLKDGLDIEFIGELYILLFIDSLFKSKFL